MAHADGPTNPQSIPSATRGGWLWVGLLVLAGLAAYANCFTGEFIFDDNGGIVGNPYLAHPAQWTDVFKAPPRTTTAGRPVICLINALNYTLSGLTFAGWRAVNLGIHLLCALTLFGIVWRTLRYSPVIADRLKTRAPPLGFAVALLFLLHPLQTAAVNYIIQRSESAMALFYLLTFYCSIRGWQSGRRVWFAGAVAACALGMGSKEVMVSAPVMVWSYDWIFNDRPFKGVQKGWAALRESWGLYAGLAASWAIVIALYIGGKTSEGAQAGRLPYSGWGYLQTQGDVICYYLRLSLVPHPLCFDYGWPPVRSLSEALQGMGAVGFLVVATIRALFKRPALGFLGLCFFAILAPSSSILPLPDPAVEYRMYLPLAPLLTLYVIGAATLFDALSARYFAVERRPAFTRVCSLASLAGVAALLAALTFSRNFDYHSASAIWGDVARNRPEHARGHINYGIALAEEAKREGPARGVETASKLQLAALEMTRGLQLKPTSENVHLNLGSVLAMLGRNREALAQFQAAVIEDPTNAGAQFNLGNLLSTLENKDAARAAYAAAIASDPNFRDAHYNLGADLYDSGKYPDALNEFEVVLRLDPQSADGYCMSGMALARLGRTAEAEARLRRALKLNPSLEMAARALGSLRDH